MKKKTWMLLGAVLLSVAVLVTVGVTTAYLTDRETADNVITIGNVSIKLEEDFETQVVVPGSKVPKAPRLTNNGNKDEFVFLKITVPKKEVTLLYEQNETDSNDPPTLLHAKGTPKTDPPTQEMAEIFRFLANDTIPAEDEGTSTTIPCGKVSVTVFDEDFTYHNTGVPAASVEGWVLLESDSSGEDSNSYIFGYNKKLKPDQETVTLFDRVQLKSFIDGEAIAPAPAEDEGDSGTSGTETAPARDEVEIGVWCCGIQADNLTVSGDGLTADYLSKDTLNAIWTIVQNKVNGKNTQTGDSGTEP